MKFTSYTGIPRSLAILRASRAVGTLRLVHSPVVAISKMDTGWSMFGGSIYASTPTLDWVNWVRWSKVCLRLSVPEERELSFPRSDWTDVDFFEPKSREKIAMTAYYLQNQKVLRPTVQFTWDG